MFGRIASIGTKALVGAAEKAKPIAEELINAKGLNFVGQKGNIVVGNVTYSSGNKMTEFYKLGTDKSGQDVLEFLGHRTGVIHDLGNGKTLRKVERLNPRNYTVNESLYQDGGLLHGYITTRPTIERNVYLADMNRWGDVKDLGNGRILDGYGPEQITVYKDYVENFWQKVINNLLTGKHSVESGVIRS